MSITRATTDWDLEHEAFVVREDAISFTVSVERLAVIVALGSISWSAVN